MMRFDRIVFGIALFLSVPFVVSAQSGASGGGRGRAQPSSYDITVQTTTPGASLTIDGAGVKGMLPHTLTVPAGPHTFRVTANGYRDWEQTIDIRSNQTINANLEQITNTLTVTSNVPARVFLNGTDSGQTRWSRALVPGRYSITVRAPGYLDFTATVNLNRGQTIDAELQPAVARGRISIPQSLLDSTNPGAANMINVFIDGRPQVRDEFEIPPGRHTIRVRAGGLVAELTRDFEAGVNYVIVPSFTASIQTE